ncbi:LacI family DNA-binding transcriptional regulator [Rhizomonospora bruguierae]|uniref:LacI family DNA-binding transcriptional regulator n=1 Tax=Rhizomonospora bruguierae TaxID=1581705 RepID=UPI001BCD3823|nr:LacI family DNA-binding transcriptional regulator [Micromonospora sp. NBRC 107566]
MTRSGSVEPARLTIYDVARHAGVSSSTVSRVLAGRGTVSEATRQRVLGVARELGYRPNHVARSLARQDSDAVAVLLPDIANPFFPSLVKALQDEAQHRGYTVILGSTGDDPDNERRYLDTMLSRQVRHVFVVGLSLPKAEVEEYARAGLTFIGLDRGVAGGNGYLVQSDNRAGAKLATRHLIELGHRRIAHIAGPPGISVSRERRRGFLEAMAEAGLPVDERLIVTSPFTEEGGAAAFVELAGRSPGYTAIFSANDLIAIGALFAAHESGLSVPEDFSLVGFDDVSLTRYTSPQLTTVRQDVARMARAGVQFIQADRPAPRRRTVTLPVSLEVRQSTTSPTGRHHERP